MSPTAPPRVLANQLLGLALATALAGFGSASWGAQPCVLDSVAGLSAPSPNPAHPAAVDFKLLQTAPADDAWLAVGCSDTALTRLRLQLAPGEQRSITLVAESGLTTALDGLIESAEGLASGQWDILVKALSIDPDGVLRPANVSDQHATIQVVQIDISAGPDNQPGQEQSWRIAYSLLLVLEVPGEEPLFRDQFRIDPRLGQFSQRRPKLRSLQHEAASARLIHHPTYCGTAMHRVCCVSLGRASSPYG